ncbi:MAG: peroxiredoxin [Acidobacteriota bacterium]
MALTVGSTAPQFTLIDTERKPRSLSEFLGTKKKTVLLFYPGAFTGACQKEMCAFRDAMTQFNEMDAQIVGISVDSPFANHAFAEKNGLQFPLLSDFTRETAKAYVGVYDNFAGVPGYTVAKRSVFVIDGDGKITYTWVSEDKPAAEPPYEEVKEAVK